ncbi:MAG: DUF3775 domain-containing protein [Bradyrhizobium sp.]|uniref:DUF3775 domain-containing protein n=1 Tax=Bradyrhizobium sp. TaxID=376 RepID=UPI001D905A05|nr:DUF3775 domain-containing protein [Bradyrhizobium sp.]MBV9560530.1 DUF3775 domain-containing protein [Bradyrhizobium sp.]
MQDAPNLSISPEKVFFIVSKARQSDIEASEPELLSDLTDDDAEGGGSSRTTDRAELAAFIRDLNVDEQIDLVALMWLGRGDGERDNLRELRQDAVRAHNNRTATYLMDTPMLADYLEEAMAEFGLSPEDFEENH